MMGRLKLAKQYRRAPCRTPARPITIRVSGSAKFLAEHGVDTASLAAPIEARRQKAATVICVSVASKLAGFVAIADPIKATTPQALQALKTAGVRRHADWRRQDHGGSGRSETRH